jgi:hypothetical protein
VAVAALDILLKVAMAESAVAVVVQLVFIQEVHLLLTLVSQVVVDNQVHGLNAKVVMVVPTLAVVAVVVLTT